MCKSRRARVLGRRLDGHQGLRPRRVRGVTTTIVRCRDCGLIYSSPQPVPETLAQHYERPPENYWRDRQMQSSDAGGVPLGQFRAVWHGDRRPRAVDIGAGLGQTMDRLARAGFEVWGCEPSAQFRDRAIERGIRPERLQLATVEEAAYEPRSFDLVSFCAVLEHIADPARALERALPWLAPEGVMFIEVPSAGWLIGRLLNLAYRVQRLDYVTNLSPMHAPYHLYEFTIDAFQRHGRRAGYTVASARFLPCETFLPKPFEPTAQRLMATTGTGMQLQVWLARR